MKSARSALWCLLPLSLLGMALSAYLYFLHLGLLRGELIVAPGCGSGMFNCHAVTEGSWGSVLGMPIALWGLIGYITVAALSILGWQSPEWTEHALALIMVLAFLFVAIDVVLFIIMVSVIRLGCLYCLFTYGVNVLLCGIAWRARPRPILSALGQAMAVLIPSTQRRIVAFFWFISILGVALVVAAHGAVRYVNLGDPAAFEEQLRQYITRQPRVKVPISNDPELGSADASIQIVEFSDFFCPACQRAWNMNKIILPGHQRDIRFVFKHFPLDTICNSSVSRMVHPGACDVAAASECAHAQGKFWQFHDRIFEKGSKYQLRNVKQDAQDLGLDVAKFSACLESGEGMEAVKRDVAEGIQSKISSTPTYIINGVPMAGGVSPPVFETLKTLLRQESR